MPSYIVSPEAEEDIFQIWAYLLQEAGRETADRIERELLDVFRRLAAVPGMGHWRSDLTRVDVRFLALYQYMIVYRTSSTLQILAVIHGKRDIQELLKDRL